MIAKIKALKTSAIKMRHPIKTAHCYDNFHTAICSSLTFWMLHNYSKKSKRTPSVLYNWWYMWKVWNFKRYVLCKYQKYVNRCKNICSFESMVTIIGYAMATDRRRIISFNLLCEVINLIHWMTMRLYNGDRRELTLSMSVMQVVLWIELKYDCDCETDGYDKF